MASYDDALETVADTRTWETAAAVLAGFLAPSILRNSVEGRTNFDVPDEGYGVAVMALSSYSPMYQRELAIGGGLYATDKALTRFGVKGKITSAGV